MGEGGEGEGRFVRLNSVFSNSNLIYRCNIKKIWYLWSCLFRNINMSNAVPPEKTHNMLKSTKLIFLI